MDVIELPPNGIYFINLDTNELNLLPWKHNDNVEIDSLIINKNFLELPWFSSDHTQVIS